MWAARPLALLLILSVLSACAGARATGRDLENSAVDKGGNPPTTYADVVEAKAAGALDQDRLLLERSMAAAAQHGPRYRHAPSDHDHREPSAQEQYAAEVALLITAQIFVCSFVVVVLDGHCDFHVSTGYYYY